MKEKKEQKEQKQESVVTSVRISKEAWKRIRIRSIEEDRDLRDVIGDAIIEYVDRPIRGVRS